MESVRCELCGADRYTVVHRYRRDKYFEHLPDPAREGRVVVCRACGYVYQNPRWDARELEAIYSEEMRRKQDPRPEHVEAALQEARHTAGWICAHLPARTGGGRRLLDIGSGHGFLLRAFQELGWEALGLEPRGSSGDYARRMFQVQVQQGYFSPSLFSQPFDLITLTATLEHLPRPIERLAQIRQVLRPDGVLFVDVPNIHRPYVMIPRSFFVSIHLQLFSPSTLRRSLEQAGYQVVQLDDAAHPLLRALAQPAEAPPVARNGGARDDAEHRRACRSTHRLLRHHFLRVGWKELVKQRLGMR
jgi:SAM-dependent methyltransferase